MSSPGHSLSVVMPATGVRHCEEDADWVCCLACGMPLGLTQPESDEPTRLIGTCEGCGRWYLLDWVPDFREGLMLLLPDHADLLQRFANDLKSKSEIDGDEGDIDTKRGH